MSDLERVPSIDLPKCLLGPFLTSELAGIGGRIKQGPEDFIVEEIPVYQPCGDGEHLFLWLEKVDVDNDRLLRHLSSSLGIPQRDIGLAGQKDRVARTTQFVSVPTACHEKLAAVDTDSIRILDAIPHGNKLKSGHLAGNRFEVTIRDVANGAFQQCTRIVDDIRILGFPNYFGIQRFGRGGGTVKRGLELLNSPKNKRSRLDRRQLRLALSAAQSLLFNQVLACRIQQGLMHQVMQGDVMQLRTSGGCFVVEDVDAEQSRFDGRETTLTGSMFGPKMRAPQDQPQRFEAEVLERFGLCVEQFRSFPKLTRGSRRPMLEWPQDLNVVEVDNGLKLTFALRKGVYATSMLREIMKPVDET